MLNNIIYKGRDNEVFIAFTFDGDFAALGLANFTEITLSLGGEEYSTIATPEELLLKDNFTLTLKIGGITNLSTGSYPVEVIGINATYSDGFVLNCAASSKIERVIVKDC